MTEFYRIIEQWAEDDLQYLPSLEDEQYEYKSSGTPKEKLIEKIGKAASAFWNAGGGIFIAGIDNNGKIDGGVPNSFFGRQQPRDWVDQAIAKVQPSGTYVVKIIQRTDPRSAIKENCSIIIIGFGVSPIAPHMAPDNKYYVRLGAHSEPASHFIVEALRARRGIQHPQLSCILRAHKKTNVYVELAVIAITNAPALNVNINLNPVPRYLAHFHYQFPINIGVIDKDNPFSFIVTHVTHTMGSPPTHFSDTEFNIELTYQDILGNIYSLQQKLTVSENFIAFPDPIEREAEKIVKSIATLTAAVKEIKKR